MVDRVCWRIADDSSLCQVFAPTARPRKQFPARARCAPVALHSRRFTVPIGVVMRLFYLLFLAAAATANPMVEAQSAVSDAGSNTSQAANPEATLRYIHEAWDTLTRSMVDCHSLVDIKVTANPVLYMPAELPPPPEAVALEQKCHVKVVPLPKRVTKLGDLRPDELPAPGLLYLPYPYVVRSEER